MEFEVLDSTLDSTRDSRKARQIIEFLSANQKTLCVVESCTGGLLSYQFCKISGASSVYRGGIVSYQDAVKCEVLGVSREFLAAHSAYSVEVVEGMLAGALKLMRSDFAIATSGVAGPSGACEAASVGDVFIGVGGSRNRAFGDCENRANFVVKKAHFNGNRAEVQHQAVSFALELFVTTFVK